VKVDRADAEGSFELKYFSLYPALLVALAGGTAVIWATNLDLRSFKLTDSQEETKNLLKSFRSQHKAQMEVNFSDLYGKPGQFRVLHSKLQPEINDDEQSGQTCQHDQLRACRTCPSFAATAEWSQALGGLSNSGLDKRSTLDRYIYEGTPLPQDFVTSPPFVDMSGQSYAYLLSKQGSLPYSLKIWAERHLSFFKVSELEEIMRRHSINSPQFALIARLNTKELEEVIRGSELIMAGPLVLIKHQNRLGFSPLSYLIYEAKDLSQFLAHREYVLASADQSPFCLQAIGNACWTYNPKHLISYLYRYSLFLILCTALIVITFVFLLFKASLRKSQEQAKQKLALQVLSHEFRTPVSSILLTLDQLARPSTTLDQTTQELIARLSTEAYRLKRIVEVSKTYLQSNTGRVQFNEVEIPSLNKWLSEFAEDQSREVQIAPLAVDRSIRADPFWLHFVVSTLVENAFAHGKPPVLIKAFFAQQELCFAIEDKGSCAFQTLKEMSQSFVKSPTSSGMGLGLNIANFIVRQWGGRIEFTANPTKFTFTLG
jgi:hypothetical protein